MKNNNIEPIDMNINNNDYSEKLLAGINSELKNIQLNIENSSKELDEQGKLLINSKDNAGETTQNLKDIDSNIFQITAKKRSQIILMYTSSLLLFMIILGLIIWKFYKI